MASIPRIKVCRNETRTPARPGCAQRPGRAGVLVRFGSLSPIPRASSFHGAQATSPRRRCDDVGLSCGCAIRTPQRPLDNRRPAVHDAPPAEPQHEVLIQQLLEPLLLAVGQKRARVVVPNNGPNGSAKGPQALAQRGRIVGIQEQVAAEQRMQLKTPHAVPLAQKLRPGTKQAERMEGSTSLRQARAAASSEPLRARATQHRERERR